MTPCLRKPTEPIYKIICFLCSGSGKMWHPDGVFDFSHKKCWKCKGKGWTGKAPPPLFSHNVLDLAMAIHCGEDCGFALHDALIDAGQDKLAEHFQEESQHPRGCWAIHLILGQ